ncbi:MAG: 2-C-methyl-D-erythritol 4-phosphate cytidylyltransferase [Litorilituus sp.]|nr:2-C-methyl-D-erythritol 4-phosphate cytidylyltransferase [Litorilituus sp.]
MPQELHQYSVIVPAAGVGKRMLANYPKQYLQIEQQSILSHTVNRLLTHKKIAKVIVVLSENDEYFNQTNLTDNDDIIKVIGGKERVDSVLQGLYALSGEQEQWVLVHDAARPCVTHQDIDNLIEQCITEGIGGLLAVPVTDTIKQSDDKKSENKLTTVERSHLWHALTPQMYKTVELIKAIEQAQQQGLTITDESSAIELAGLPSQLVLGSRENIKITRPEDLSLATFYLEQQLKTNLKDNSCV